MLSYLIETSLCWAVFYGFYVLLLSRTTFFRHNRWFLLTTLALGLIIPLMELPPLVAPATEQFRSIYLAPVTAGIETLEVTVTASATAPRAVDGWLILRLLYWAGVALAAARFAYGLWQLHKMYQGAEVVHRDGYTVVFTGKPHLPFSFFRWLFWSNTLEADDPDRRAILRHEQAHIRQGHSFDVLLLELLGILFWCSPFIHLYRRDLTTVHEYLADAAVLCITRKKQYGHLLIRQSQSGMPVALANHFAQTQLKKRIFMMTRHRTPGTSALRYTLAIPLTLFLLLAFANQELISQTILEIRKPGGIIEKFEFATDDEMKQHVGKIDPTDIEMMDVRKGDQNRIIITLRDPLQPKDKNAAEEKVLIREAPAGSGENVNIRLASDTPPILEVRRPGAPAEIIEFDSGEELKQYLAQFAPADIQMMNVFKGEQDRIILTLREKVLQNVDEMPRFPGCEDLTDAAERQNCANQELMKFVFSQIRYPEEARKAGIEGTAVIRFVIDKEGNITDPQMARSLGSGTDEELLRVLEAMPRWIPGRHEGQPVAVEFNLPVRFKLSEEEKAAVVNKLPGANQEKSLELSTFNVAPNPSAGQLNLRFDADAAPTTIRVVDLNGRELFRQQVNDFDGHYQSTLDLSTAGSGTFLLLIQQGEKVYSERIVLQ